MARKQVTIMPSAPDADAIGCRESYTFKAGLRTMMHQLEHYHLNLYLLKPFVEFMVPMSVYS